MRCEKHFRRIHPSWTRTKNRVLKVSLPSLCYPILGKLHLYKIAKTKNEHSSSIFHITIIQSGDQQQQQKQKYGEPAALTQSHQSSSRPRITAKPDQNQKGKLHRSSVWWAHVTFTQRDFVGSCAPPSPTNQQSWSSVDSTIQQRHEPAEKEQKSSLNSELDCWHNPASALLLCGATEHRNRSPSAFLSSARSKKRWSLRLSERTQR